MNEKFIIMVVSGVFSLASLIITVLIYCYDESLIWVSVCSSIFTGFITLLTTSIINFVYERKQLIRAFLFQYKKFINDVMEFLDTNNSFDKLWYNRQLYFLSLSIIELNRVSKKQGLIAINLKDILLRIIPNLEKSDDPRGTFNYIKSEHLDDLVNTMINH